MSLTKVLLEAQSQDQHTRLRAEQSLTLAEETDFSNFVRELAAELKNSASPETARQLAGLLLKNAFSSSDHKVDKVKRQKWTDLPRETSECVKLSALETTAADNDAARSAACQVISKIARVELPVRQWEELIPNLLAFAADGSISARKGALTAYGYICEDIHLMADEIPSYPDLFSPEACNSILTGVVTGMKHEDKGVKLIATRALTHAVIFAYRNIQNEEERSYLFRVIGENLKDKDPHIQQAAWEVVLQMACEYYEFLEPYMNELGTLSLTTISNSSNGAISGSVNEMIALPAVEFWNVLCDAEIQILNGESDRPMKGFISMAKQHLLPVLFAVMTKQSSEEVEPCDWTLSMAAGTCVGLCAEVLRDDILELALGFVNANFNHSEWQNRESAVFAYGSIMEGPSSERLQPLVKESFRNLCQRLDDESVAVRDTTAWTIGRIAKFQFPCINGLLGAPQQPGLVQFLIAKLSDDPRVAQQICFALHEIACHCCPNGEVVVNSGSDIETPLDPWLSDLVESLYQTTQRADVDERKLRTASFTALASVLSYVNGREKSVVVHTIFERLILLLDQSVNIPLTDEVSQLQTEICVCLEVCIQVTSANWIVQHSERAYSLFWRVIYGNAPVLATNAVQGTSPYRISVASEDALLAIAALANSLRSGFEPFAENFCKVLHQGLRNPEDESFCEKCIDIVGDVSRVLGKQFAIYAHEVLQDIYNILKDKAAQANLKPRAATAIGDVAISMGGAFESFLGPFLEILKQATQTRMDQGPMENEDWIEFIQNLRDGVLWAYKGIVYGLQADDKLVQLKQNLSVIVDFIKHIVEDPKSSSGNFSKAVELLGDLASSFPEIANYLKQRDQFYMKLCRAGSSHADQAVKEQTRNLQMIVGN